MIATAVAVLLAQSSLAEPNSMITIGVGSGTCRDWTIRRTRGGHPRENDRQWIVGFVTGVAFISSAMGMGELFRDEDDPETLIGFVDDYCARNPLKSVGQAAQMLWLELDRRAAN